VAAGALWLAPQGMLPQIRAHSVAAPAPSPRSKGSPATSLDSASGSRRDPLTLVSRFCCLVAIICIVPLIHVVLGVVSVEAQESEASRAHSLFMRGTRRLPRAAAAPVSTAEMAPDAIVLVAMGSTFTHEVRPQTLPGPRLGCLLELWF
jgi:hypothetical protein